MSFITIGSKSLTEHQVKDLLHTDHPLVEEFNLEKIDEYPGYMVQFKLHIILRNGVRFLQTRDANGDRITPTWKTSPEKAIGAPIRTIAVENDQIVAHNSRCYPEQSYNDLGIISSMYVSMERLYRELGVRLAMLNAVLVGRYAWARQGFNFEHSSKINAIARCFAEFTKQHGLIVNESDLKNAWDFANCTWGVPGEETDWYPLGKYYMLNHFDSWYGTKDLYDKTQCRVAELSRRETFSRLPEKIEGLSKILDVI